MILKFKRLWKEQKAQDLTEYALIMLMVALAAVAATKKLSGTIGNSYTAMTSDINIAGGNGAGIAAATTAATSSVSAAIGADVAAAAAGKGFIGALAALAAAKNNATHCCNHRHCSGSKRRSSGQSLRDHVKRTL